MFRVSQCCCGCSLRTGTLILLWLDLLNQVSSLVHMIVAVCDSRYKFSFFESSLLTWECISLVIVIYALAGVEKHRPSYMLPYIGMCVVSLVLMVFFTALLWVGSLALRDQLVNMIYHKLQTSPSQRDNNLSEQEIRDGYNTAVSLLTFFLVVAFSLSLYWFSVVYSYYKQMQEEDKGIFTPPGTGIVYATPVDQPKQAYNDCPPAYGQQPAPYPQMNAGYPPQNTGYPQQNAGYPQQFPVYPQLAGEKQ